MRRHRWILWLVVIAFGVLVVRSFTDFRTLIATLVTGYWPWLLAALILHLSFFVAYALLYQVGFATVGVATRVRDLVPLVFAGIFANAVVPIGGASAAALFIDHALEREQSGAAAAVGTILVLIADLSTLVPFLIFGMVSLALRHDLKAYEILGGAIFTAFVGALCAGLLLANWKPGWLLRALRVVERLVDRVGGWFRRPDLLSEGWAERNAAEFVEATAALHHHPGRLSALLGLGLFVHWISLISLYTVFQAYRQPIVLGPLVAGFGTGIVFWVVAIVPQGIGATEGIMTLVFMSLGIPRTQAITIVLVFRGVNFYLPLLIGFFCLRHGQAFGFRREGEADAPGGRGENRAGRDRHPDL